MARQLSYISFQTLPVKARKSIIADILSDKYGYDIPDSGKQREKAYTKALTSFQKSIGLAGNGVICEATFNAISPVVISK